MDFGELLGAVPLWGLFAATVAVSHLAVEVGAWVAKLALRRREKEPEGPLNDAVSAYSSVMYLHPSASIGPEAAMDEGWNLIVGLTFYPGRNSRTRTVAGERWMPLLPVATNGTFLVDTDNRY